ncbi:MAG TPA: ATP-binding protein [Vicinamibacteria bacterium]|nr:ATP-binding protein [Vicinamibacteria bacterium]
MGDRVVSRAGWLIALSIVAVGAVNVAGVWGIAVARRAAAEDATRLFAGETAARARGLEAVLSGIRSDMAFLGASAPLAAVESAPRAAGSWREGAESVLLLFLRTHPEVVRTVVSGADGRPLVLTGRRGGIPVLWVSSNPTGLEGAATDPRRPRLTTALELGGAARLEAEIAPATLLHGERVAAGAPCVLEDAAGSTLARSPEVARASAGREPERRLAAEARVDAEGWSAAGPWRLACWRPEGPAVAAIEPLAGRYRATVALNLAAMALAVLLGFAAIQQTRRRERLEARAREESRVRELERQLFHAERLATVGRLAAGIAHEINNPLEGMANYLTLARDALARGEVAAAEGRLRSVREGLDRAAGIVRQVLDHADPSAVPRTQVDLARVLDETARFVQSRPEFRDVHFALDLPSAPLLVLGNAVMLGQVAVNLILNACEAQPGGGRVEVRARREDGQVVAEVADRGPGIPEADRHRIFEPFYSTKDSTGLGLSVCHSIVRDHGGDLSAAGREGGGSVFRMRLPALEAA